jgi:hypothetical protein
MTLFNLLKLECLTAAYKIIHMYEYITKLKSHMQAVGHWEIFNDVTAVLHFKMFGIVNFITCVMLDSYIIWGIH